MTQVAQVDLPWPPTVNDIWRAVKGRNILSKRYRSWRARALAELVVQRERGRLNPVSGPVTVSIDLYPPDGRIFDIDNRIKACLDALVEACIIEADDLRTVRGVCVKACEVCKEGGFARVFIEQWEQPLKICPITGMPED